MSGESSAPVTDIITPKKEQEDMETETPNAGLLSDCSLLINHSFLEAYPLSLKPAAICCCFLLTSLSALVLTQNAVTVSLSGIT